jgi:hypothetical protein
MFLMMEKGFVRRKVKGMLVVRSVVILLIVIPLAIHMNEIGLEQK